MDAQHESELVRRALEGDERAFGGLVEAYERVLFNLALRMVNDREDARDLTQTVFLKAYRHLATFDRRHKFFSWIYRIMLNESLNFISRRKRHEELDDRLVSTDSGPEDRADGSQVRDIIQSALTDLTLDYRQVIILRHYLQLSHREMSEVLNVPEKTVKSRLYTARQQLGEILQRRGLRRA